jgi:glycerate kinase
MRVLIASDKFKGSLTAQQACEAIRDGLLLSHPDASIDLVPLADGGEGTSELLARHVNGTVTSCNVTGPLFEKITASYGLSGDALTAFIESASASGLQLIPLAQRNPLRTTTFGTGELIVDALRRGAKEIVIGIGGTATNDAGAGIALALGYHLLDERGINISGIGADLIRLISIDRSGVNAAASRATFIALCDVDNPLYGERGAAFTYGPQKGADQLAVKTLDNGLRNFEKVVRKSLNKEADFPGAGAGGGLASGAHVFLNAKIRRGMDYVMEVTALKEKIMKADLIITGEGKIDTQTLAGKVVGTVSTTARSFNKQVLAVCGVCELREVEIQKMGISKVISLVDPFTNIDEALRNAANLLRTRVRDSI